MQLVDCLIISARCSINTRNRQHVEKVLTIYPVTTIDFISALLTADSTALDEACYFEHLDIVKYLVEQRSDY